MGLKQDQLLLAGSQVMKQEASGRTKLQLENVKMEMREVQGAWLWDLALIKAIYEEEVQELRNGGKEQEQ